MSGQQQIIAAVERIFKRGGGADIDGAALEHLIESGGDTGDDLACKAALGQIMEEWRAVQVGDITDAQVSGRRHLSVSPADASRGGGIYPARACGPGPVLPRSVPPDRSAPARAEQRSSSTGFRPLRWYKVAREND